MHSIANILTNGILSDKHFYEVQLGNEVMSLVSEYKSCEEFESFASPTCIIFLGKLFVIDDI